MNDELSAAIAAAYHVFAQYDFAGAGEADSDGIGPLERRVLRLTPPHELPPAVVAAYAADVSAASGRPDADDFRAVLPRLLELVAAGAIPTHDAAAALVRADYSARWPVAEVAAVVRVLATLPVALPREPARADAG